MKKILLLLSLSACGSETETAKTDSLPPTTTQAVKPPTDQATIEPPAPKYSGGGWCDAEDGWIPGAHGCVLDQPAPEQFVPPGKRLVIALNPFFNTPVPMQGHEGDFCASLNILPVDPEYGFVFWRPVAGYDSEDGMGHFVMSTLWKNLDRHIITPYVIWKRNGVGTYGGSTFIDHQRFDYEYLSANSWTSPCFIWIKEK